MFCNMQIISKKRLVHPYSMQCADWKLNSFWNPNLDMVINGLDNAWDWSFTLSNRSNCWGRDGTTSNYAEK